MTDPRHARILANIARQVVRKYQVTDSAFNQCHAPDLIGQVFDTPPSYVTVRVHESWNYTLPERYQA